MRHLNYNHLLYFWTVAREGSIVRAAESMHVTPQTISGQIKMLEESVGQALFNRAGRRLVLSEMGQVVFEYADELFSIGTELAQVVSGGQVRGAQALVVGVVSSMPKLIAERILAPATTADKPVPVRCHEAPLNRLLADLSILELDLVLSDQPAPQGLNLRAYNHLLGKSGMSFFLKEEQCGSIEEPFPQCLNDRPILLPTQNSALRRRMEEWFEQHGLTPRILGEFDDSALMKAFGEAGIGIFAGPSVIEQEIQRMYRVGILGRTDEVTENFYAISPERRLKHESVVLITNTARADLFG